MAVRLFLKEIANNQGISMSELQRRTLLPMSTTQRYWHGVGAKGEPLQSINLDHIDRLCEVLGVNVGDLLRRVEVESEHGNA
jgi:DNA-binding Xre family transcriptional regulator